MGLSLIALACLPAPPTVGKAVPLPEWNAAFAGGEGWIGGDGAYSVPLGKDRVLWLFGNAFELLTREVHEVHQTLVSACKGIRVRVNCCVRIAPVPTGAQR